MSRALKIVADGQDDQDEIDQEADTVTETLGRAEDPGSEIERFRAQREAERLADIERLDAEHQAALAALAALEPEPRAATAEEAQERLKVVSAELARVSAANDDLLAKRDGYEKELGELKAEHRRIAGGAIAGKTAAIKRIGEIVQRSARLETEVLPTVAIAIEQAEPIGPAREAVAQAQAECHRFEMLAVAREVVDESRNVDAAMRALTVALGERQASVQRYSATAQTQVETETAHRLVNSSAVSVAWAHHGLPGAIPVRREDTKSLAALDAAILNF